MFAEGTITHMTAGPSMGQAAGADGANGASRVTAALPRDLIKCVDDTRR